MKVLIVEDEITSAFLMERAVSALGEPTVVNDGASALKLIQEAYDGDSRFDCIVLDLHLPGIDGIELLHSLRKFEELKGVTQGQGTPVLVVSAHSDPHSIHETLAEGAVDFLSKPVTLKKIREKVHRMARKLPWGHLEPFDPDSNL